MLSHFLFSEIKLGLIDEAVSEIFENGGQLRRALENIYKHVGTISSACESNGSGQL